MCIYSTWKLKRTNLKVVFVGERVVDRLNEGSGSQNLVGHLVHCVLHAGAVVLCECAHGDGPDIVPGLVEFGNVGADLVECRKSLPMPIALNFRAKDTIPNFGQLRVFVAVEAVECGARALQDEQLVHTRFDRDAFALSCHNLDFACLLAVTIE
jgi:hypothetical protein